METCTAEEGEYFYLVLRIPFKKAVPSPDSLMGVKAVWGLSREAVMCFGSRGDPHIKSKGYFSQARITAEQALNRPYFVTIGGGAQVPDALAGRAIELVRATSVYGETEAFVRDDELRSRLAQWPVAIIISEVYSIASSPRIVEDLGFFDRSILTNAYDAVIRRDDHIRQLWNALKEWEVERRWDVLPPQGFRDPGTVRLCGSLYPKLDSASSEGRRVWRLSQEIERDPTLKREAKAANRSQNAGVLVCEACGFSDELDAMFDVHHLQPLAAGLRDSRIDDLSVLCPTCHRWAHSKTKDKMEPLSISALALHRGKFISQK